MNQILKKVVLAAVAACGLTASVQAVGAWNNLPIAGKGIVGVLGAGCVTLCVSSKARRTTGRGIAWPFKAGAKSVSWIARTVDPVQRSILTTKTTQGKLSLLALTCAYLRAYGPGLLSQAGAQGQLGVQALCDGDLQAIRTALVAGLVGPDNFLGSPLGQGDFLKNPFYAEAIPSYILWAAIGLTAWNNDRYDRDAKKAELEAKKAPVAVAAAEKSE